MITDSLPGIRLIIFDSKDSRKYKFHFGLSRDWILWPIRKNLRLISGCHRMPEKFKTFLLSIDVLRKCTCSILLDVGVSLRILQKYNPAIPLRIPFETC